MKRICLFSRLELTRLYGCLNVYLEKNYQLIHLAYSDVEEKMLKAQYGINFVVNFKNEISKLLNNQKINFELLQEIDLMFIQQSQGRFNLNSSIRYDRSFEGLGYNDCLLLCQVYYIFWKGFLNNYKIDFIFHEPPAVFMTHVAANLCKQLGIIYLSQSQVSGINDFNWIFIEGDSGHPIEWESFKSEILNMEERTISRNYIERFRQEYNNIFFNKLNNNTTRKKSFSYQLLSIKNLFKCFADINISSDYNDTSLINHYETYNSRLKPHITRKLFNFWFRNYKLKYDVFNPNEKFYFYPLHAEPEAAVLYRGDGIYSGQVKLIENIAEQLPPLTYLYVKDHPHRSAFTDMLYFERLLRIPNIKLIDPSIPGRIVTRFSRGVFTISGTVGFEAILFNKPVFLFGQAFYMYSNRVYKVRNIRDLREMIYKVEGINFNDDEELYSFVYKFLNISHNGFIAYFPNHINKIHIDFSQNCQIVAEGIHIGIQRIIKN